MSPREDESLLTYRPLEHNSSFRVLEILPGENEEPLSCRLHHDSLDQPCEYEALSYTWGLDENESILCDGKRVGIRPNLLSFLLELRSSTESRIVWADAMCINQSDIEERNSQVSKMLHIFSRAKRVIIWLGPDSEGVAGAAIDTLRAVADGRLHAGASVIAEASSRRWQALSVLFMQPWFSRIWVVQEVVNHAKVELMYGSHSIDWKLAGDAIQHLCDHNNDSIFHKFNFWQTEIWSAQTMLDDELRLPAFGNLHRLHLLYRLRRFMATDPRDKIFAVLGLKPFRALREEDDGNAERTWIPIDYKKTREEVYRELAETIIFSPPLNLDPLSYVMVASAAADEDPLPSGVADEDSLPSWVPQWDKAWHTTDCHVLVQHLRWNGPDKNCSHDFPVFIGKKDDDPRILQALGVLWDTVDHTQPIQNEFWFAPQKHGLESSPFLEFWQGLDLQQKYPTGESVETALSMVFPAGSLGRPLKSEDLTARFLSWVSRIQEAYGASRNVAGGPLQRCTEADSQEWARGAQNMTWNRTFFRTTNGYFGIGAKFVQKGDAVCVLGGGKVPFLLRKAGQQYAGYRLVGECYVHGIMEGEAISKVLSEGMKMLQIT